MDNPSDDKMFASIDKMLASIVGIVTIVGAVFGGALWLRQLEIDGRVNNAETSFNNKLMSIEHENKLLESKLNAALEAKFSRHEIVRLTPLGPTKLPIASFRPASLVFARRLPSEVKTTIFDDGRFRAYNRFNDESVWKYQHTTNEEIYKKWFGDLLDTNNEFRDLQKDIKNYYNMESHYWSSSTEESRLEDTGHPHIRQLESFVLLNRIPLNDAERFFGSDPQAAQLKTFLLLADAFQRAGFANGYTKFRILNAQMLNEVFYLQGVFQISIEDQGAKRKVTLHREIILFRGHDSYYSINIGVYEPSKEEVTEVTPYHQRVEEWLQGFQLGLTE
jgi:hypothetical protein